MGAVGRGGRHLEEVIRATEERAIDAQGSLGICYATLRCPDLEKSRHWYLQAALQGNTQAMYEIGLTLLLGEGGEADPEQAIEWLEKAAMTCDWAEEDRQVLADAYEHGSNGVPKDFARSEYGGRCLRWSLSDGVGQVRKQREGSTPG